MSNPMSTRKNPVDPYPCSALINDPIVRNRNKCNTKRVLSKSWFYFTGAAATLPIGQHMGINRQVVLLLAEGTGCSAAAAHSPSAMSSSS
eukprot:805919-Pyramimonas_sp.AAC.1